MARDGLQVPGNGFAASRVFYAAGGYDHPASGTLQLRLVRRGSSQAKIDLGSGPKSMFTRPGDLLLTMPDKPTLFCLDDSRELILVEIDPEYARALLLPVGGDVAELAPLCTTAFREPLIVQLCRRLEALPITQVQPREWALGLLLHALLQLANVRTRRTRRSRLAPDAIVAVIAYVDDHLTERITVDDLASTVGLVPRSFSGAFRAATGLPAYQFVLQQRANRAMQLLRTTSLSFVEIAHQTGFAHQSHLTRTLRSLTGRTPSAIRSG